MHRFRTHDLKTYLRAVDSHLDAPFRLIVIGGSAALLGYGISRVTQDIDTWDNEHSKIRDALELARKETGLEIPIQHPGVQDGPYFLEDRLKRICFRGLCKLMIQVPEKHDLVLMKMIRGEQPDMEVAEEIKTKRGLSSETLTKRYLEEMSHVVGDSRRLDLNFLALMDRLFGTEIREHAQRQLKSSRPRPR